jgi:Zn-finger nucleic acid-binding protein
MPMRPDMQIACFESLSHSDDKQVEELQKKEKNYKKKEKKIANTVNPEIEPPKK